MATAAGSIPPKTVYQSACMKGFRDFGIVGTASRKESRTQISKLEIWETKANMLDAG